MNLEKIKAGSDIPNNVNVIIEIPQGTFPVKYEFDKDSCALFVDRYIQTPMYYPAHYGFIPHTKADDGDPVDVLVVDPYPLIPGVVIQVTPIGMLVMEDEKGMDEKIIAVPHKSLNPFYKIETYQDLPEEICKQIEHFFTHYKDLEKNKWVKISHWSGPEETKQLIQKHVL